MVEPCGTPRRSKRFWDSKSLSPKVERPFKFLSTNIWPYLAWVLRWYAYSAACERVSRWSIVLKAFRGSQRWGRSNTDGIDRTSELVILWASFAWIYVNFHVWTAEIPISATGVWIPKGVLTLTTPGFYMLSLYIYIYISVCVCVSVPMWNIYRFHFIIFPCFDTQNGPSDNQRPATWRSEIPLMGANSWIIMNIMNHLQMVDFPYFSIGMFDHPRAITKSLVFIMGEVPFLGSVPPGGGRCCGSQCSVG